MPNSFSAQARTIDNTAGRPIHSQVLSIPFDKPMQSQFQTLLILAIAFLWQACLPVATLADRVQLRQQASGPAAKAAPVLEGEILIEADDGGMLFLQNDGQLKILQPPAIASKTNEDLRSAALPQKDFGQQLLAELPNGFQIHTTRHYVIAYETDRSYAKWIGNLYEGKLKKSFQRFWKNRKFRIKTQEPDFPLAAIIFSNRQSYSAWVQRELGKPPEDMVAYYNLMTNRVAMYDMTADQGNGQHAPKRDLDLVLRDPRSVRMVSTIIHEGTHQLMFNTGLQTRLADTPYWLNEGIAMFFETPDLQKKQGWRGPGQTNFERLGDILRYARHRPIDSIETLIATDRRLQSGGEESAWAYAESWAMVHFLINRKPAAFTRYLTHLAEKKRLVADEPETRIADFKKFFGEDLSQLDTEFLGYVKELK